MDRQAIGAGSTNTVNEMGIFTNFCAGVHEGTLPASRVEAILVNVPQQAAHAAAIRATSRMLAKAQPRYDMLDSGGYQFLRMEEKGGRVEFNPAGPLVYLPDRINLTPQHVIQAAMKLRTRIVTALDLPVPKISNPVIQDQEFMKKLGINLVFMTETSRLRSRYCPEIELFIPIQCYTLEQFGYIERQLVHLEFDGLSLPTRNLDPAGIALYLVKFYQMGVRKVHLLSVSNFTGIALAAYFARHVFDWCSVDATTWNKDAQYQDYRHPQDLSKISVRDDAIIQVKQLPCDCPWCSIRDFTKVQLLPHTAKTNFLRHHNYYAIQKLGHELYTRSEDFDSYIQHLRERNRRQAKKVEKLIEALTIVHYRKDESIETLRKLLGDGRL